MMTKEDSKSRYHVPNLERALKIMEYLARQPKNPTIAKIARVLEYPTNSVFRIISTLESQGYVTRNEDNKEFLLSRKMLSLGYQALVETSLIEKSIDTLRSLRDATGETALLGTILEYEGVVLDQVLSHQPIKFMVSPGTKFKLHTAAPAKAMLAFANQQEFEHQTKNMEFTKNTPKTITSLQKYKDCLEEVRSNGYAVDLEEEAEGVMCISAPIFDYRGLPIAAIWVTGPKYRLSEDKVAETGQTVKKHAANLSKQMGFVGNN